MLAAELLQVFALEYIYEAPEAERLRGVSLDIGDSFDRETESSDAGTGQSAGTGRKVHFYQEDKIKLQVHQPKYKCTTRRFQCLR